MYEPAAVEQHGPARTVSRRRLLKAGGALIGCAAYGGGVHFVLSEDRWEPNRSYWLAKTTGESYGQAVGSLRVDVAIIGGGFTGLSSAYHIKTRFPDLRVALLEARRLGFGASGRNGGLLVEGTAVSDEMPGTEGNV
ncbi:MAG: FAD-dependent oxidoreductase, partial [Phycisphaerales bacterium]